MARDNCQAETETETDRAFPSIGDTVRVTYDSPQTDDPVTKEGVVLSVSGSGTIRFWTGDDPEKHHKVVQRTGRVTSVYYSPSQFGPWAHCAELSSKTTVEPTTVEVLD